MPGATQHGDARMKDREPFSSASIPQQTNRTKYAYDSIYRLAQSVKSDPNGPLAPRSAFFQGRRKQGLSRGAIYERVRTWARKARLTKHVSPHTLRHTFATHLVQRGTALVVIREMLGHRLITSTQIYLHVTGDELRAAAQLHPIAQMATSLAQLLPDVRLPLQPAPRRRQSG